MRSKLKSMDHDALVLENPSGGKGDWLKLLRVHQWAKNLLVFVPLVSAQAFTLIAFGNAVERRRVLARRFRNVHY